MDDDGDTRVAELRHQAHQLRILTIEQTKALAGKLGEVWHELNEFVTDRPELRHDCDLIAADIARLEKLDIVLDTEWLAESQHAAEANPAQEFG
ncbi:MAG: hypothetical protein ACK5KO_09905 [Arachnia sp.]